MSKFKSYGPPTLFFEMSRGCVRSTASRALDIKNYIRANEFYTRSDMRLKNNVEDLGDENLQKLKQIIPKSYRFKNDKLIHFGFIAQDVEKVYPNLVAVDIDGMKSINYLEMVPLLLHKINNLERKVEELSNNKNNK